MSRFSLSGSLFALAVAAMSGAIYSAIILGGRPYIGASYALVIIGLLLAFEQDLIFPRLRLWLIELPTAIYYLVALVLNITTAFAGTLFVGTVLWSLGFFRVLGGSGNAHGR